MKSCLCPNVLLVKSYREKIKSKQLIFIKNNMRFFWKTSELYFRNIHDSTFYLSLLSFLKNPWKLWGKNSSKSEKRSFTKKIFCKRKYVYFLICRDCEKLYSVSCVVSILNSAIRNPNSERTALWLVTSDWSTNNHVIYLRIAIGQLTITWSIFALWLVNWRSRDLFSHCDWPANDHVTYLRIVIGRQAFQHR